MLSLPDKVLKMLGSEAKYQIAVNPPFHSVTPAMNNANFSPCIEECIKADDIYVINNSFSGRMFPVIHALHESDLEAFYNTLGLSYISKKVKTMYKVMGRSQHNTSLVLQLAKPIKEQSKPTTCIS